MYSLSWIVFWQTTSRLLWQSKQQLSEVLVQSIFKALHKKSVAETEFCFHAIQKRALHLWLSILHKKMLKQLANCYHGFSLTMASTCDTADFIFYLRLLSWIVRYSHLLCRYLLFSIVLYLLFFPSKSWINISDFTLSPMHFHYFPTGFTID